jgi:hypothetical protein
VNQVARVGSHRRPVRGRVSAEDEARVVGDVQPLVGVGGPGVGLLYPFDEVPQGRASGRPHPERPVHVHPGAGLPRNGADGAKGVYGTGVHVARLGTHYGWFGSPGKGVAQRVRPHPALLVGRDRPQASGPEA